jgi:hypothetical protein
MKLIGNTASISKDSNILISSTFADWSAIRDGTFLKFEDDSAFYVASRTEQKTYLKDYIVIQPNIIQVNENCGTNINEGDSLNISYKEYELSTINKFISQGAGYKAGDQLMVDGGKASINIRDNTPNSTIITVVSVGGSGEIIDSKIENRGKYLVPPDQVLSLKGGSGSGASIDPMYKLADHRSFIERDVQKVEFKSSETIIHLVYPLPAQVTEGKLSIEKWEVTLSSNYSGESKINKPIQVIRDHTPNYRFPLLIKNSLNQEMIHNYTTTVLDRKIKELEDRIKKLEG